VSKITTIERPLDTLGDMKPPIAMYAFLATFVVFPFVFGLRAPVSLLSVAWIVLAGLMVWRGYRWAWGILVAVQCIGVAIPVIATVFHPTVAVIATGLFGIASLILLFSKSVQQYIDRWDEFRARPQQMVS